jgi:hypothetical protein
MTNQNSDLDQLSAAELRQRLIAAQEENKALTEAFQTLTFEVRSQLTVIAGATTLLGKEQTNFPILDEQQAEIVEIAINGVNRANEVIYELLEMVEKAGGFESFGSSLVQSHRRELLEANQRLDSFEQRQEALHNLILNFVHDFYTPLTIIRAYTKLYQEKQFLPSNSLEKLIEIFESNAKLCLISFQLFRSAYATIYALYEDWNWQITGLDELLDPSEYDVQSEIEEFPPLRLPKSFSQVFRLLWHTLNGVNPKKLSLIVREENAQLNLTIISDVYSSLFVYYIDLETKKVSCNEPRALSSICIANEFVKKVGGTMLMETDVKNGSVVTLILPAYWEES